nr:putative reverse transcriptase, RNA-dependent DNA polymerase, Gag-polypeptide of LTR copia-type [Tanacetum cinerariifolium]
MVETEEIDPKTGKPKKNKGQSSSEELKLSDYNPLYLHSSDSSGNPLISFKLEGTKNYKELYLGQIYSTNAKKVWDELEETYSKSNGSVIFNMHYKIHSFTQSGMPLAEYYHKFNSQWRQYDSLVAFATFSRDESHRNSSVHNVKTSFTAFVARSNNDWSGNRNNQNKRFN